MWFISRRPGQRSRHHARARRFGLEIAETRPALVPFTARVPELAGVALPVETAAEVIWRAAHDEPLHYPVGDGPAAMLQEITPRIEATRTRWKEMFAAGLVQG